MCAHTASVRSVQLQTAPRIHSDRGEFATACHSSTPLTLQPWPKDRCQRTAGEPRRRERRACGLSIRLDWVAAQHRPTTTVEVAREETVRGAERDRRAAKSQRRPSLRQSAAIKFSRVGAPTDLLRCLRSDKSRGRAPGSHEFPRAQPPLY